MLLLAQLRVNKSVVNDYRVQVYLTDDERHVPVLVTAKLAAGQLRAELASLNCYGWAKATNRRANSYANTDSDTNAASPPAADTNSKTCPTH